MLSYNTTAMATSNAVTIIDNLMELTIWGSRRSIAIELIGNYLKEITETPPDSAEDSCMIRCVQVIHEELKKLGERE